MAPLRPHQPRDSRSAGQPVSRSATRSVERPAGSLDCRSAGLSGNCRTLGPQAGLLDSHSTGRACPPPQLVRKSLGCSPAGPATGEMSGALIPSPDPIRAPGLPWLRTSDIAKLRRESLKSSYPEHLWMDFECHRAAQHRRPTLTPCRAQSAQPHLGWCGGRGISESERSCALGFGGALPPSSTWTT